MCVCVYERPYANYIILIVLCDLNAFIFAFKTGLYNMQTGGKSANN